MTLSRSLPLAFFLSLSLTAVALAEAKNPVPVVPQGDPTMAAAYQRARLGLDGFLTTFRRPPAGSEGFAVKIGLIDAPDGAIAIVHPGASVGGVVEYFWIGELHETASGLEGRIGNEPEDIHNATAGAEIAFPKADVADWMYFQNGKIIGNATACPALARASAQERELMRKRYGLDCP